MTTMLEVFDPTVDPIPAHGVVAKRPDTLNGAVVGLLANGKNNADELLEMVHDVLADQFEFKARGLQMTEQKLVHYEAH